MLNFASRNIRIYFRQKSAVFSSLLGVFIMIVLYVVFLGDELTIEGVENSRALMASWLTAGLVAMTPFTSAVGALGCMVDDRVHGNIRDFYASPIKRAKIVGGYILSALTVALLLSVLAFAAGEAYILCCGGSLPTLTQLLQTLGAILISVTLSCTMGFLIVCFISNTSAYITISIIIGSMSGFLMGMYAPVGSLDGAVQWLVKLFPITHTAVIFRRILCQPLVEECFGSLPAEYGQQFSHHMGIELVFGDYTASVGLHITVALVLSALFFLLAVVRVSKEKRK